MNMKVVKLRDERERNRDKIAKLQTRNRDIDAQILSIENSEIIGIVRALELTPDELSKLLSGMRITRGVTNTKEDSEGEMQK